MKTLIVPLAGIGMAILLGDAATAASPAYCALYAREYANETVQPTAAPGMLQSIQDQAYYRCLNQDEDPQLPSTSAYFGADIVDPSTTVGSIDAAAADDTRGTVKPAAKPVNVAATETRRSRSGLEPWSREWAAWCGSHFPNSFDPDTGMILPYNSSRREFC